VPVVIPLGPPDPQPAIAATTYAIASDATAPNRAPVMRRGRECEVNIN
jgi:hypothetical protein